MRRKTTAWNNPVWYDDPTGMSIWITSSLQKFQDKIKEGKPNVQGSFTFRRSANGSESPLSEDEMKDKDRRLRAAINAFTDSTGKPTKIGQQILDTPLHAGSVIITEGTDQVNNVINQMAGENATEAEREIIIAGALAKGLFRLNKDGVLQVVAGKVAALDSVKQVGAQSLDMLERINAVNYGLQGVQEVVLGAARVYGAVASIATAPVTTLVGASAGIVSRAFYEEQYNNRQATLGQLAQSAELGSAVSNVGVAAVNLARVAARAVSIGDDIIQLGIAGGPKANLSSPVTGANATGLATRVDNLSNGVTPNSSLTRGAMAPPNEVAVSFSPDELETITISIENRMRELGVPERAIGIPKVLGGSGRGFNPNFAEGGGNFVDIGIEVDAGVFQPMIGWRQWNAAKVSTRIDAVIAHEFLEFQGIPHKEVLQLAPKTTMPITTDARKLLKSQIKFDLKINK